MPTVFQIGRSRVVIYPNDHRPSHVHVIGAKRWAVFFLNCPNGPVELREQSGYRKAQIDELAAEIEAALSECCEKWRLIHGDF